MERRGHVYEAYAVNIIVYTKYERVYVYLCLLTLESVALSPIAKAIVNTIVHIQQRMYEAPVHPTKITYQPTQSKYLFFSLHQSQAAAQTARRYSQ